MYKILIKTEVVQHLNITIKYIDYFKCFNKTKIAFYSAQEAYEYVNNLRAHYHPALLQTFYISI